MPDTFKIYKKNGTEFTKVAEGESPLSITGIAANTQVAKGDYQATRVVGGQESVKVDIPAFTTLPISVTGVTLDKTTAEVEQGGTLKLTPTVTPANATDKTGSWSSSNTAVATVTGGNVTVKTDAEVGGTTEVSFTTTDGGKVAKCTITVIEKAAG
ncbi:TPA: Ig domain-containing protein [Enterococcus faecium]|jgi:uncharacterized protein YjdB|uniref:Ig-like domain-containing protein n=1 Tax=Enterococcus faecium TaxID=1352 RepID=A0AAW8RGK5_ENTFC|nr:MULTISPECIES: Ig-like domain-containing protein [Enterococcus]MBC9701388.1 Ig domain-containing protein [Leuconostoc sp.]CAJ1858985.1 major tail protein [uncultured phage]DAJ00652.1 MAG TPA: tail tube protein [Caudoviricetes sp.]AOM15374.1 hypothetical protein AL014_03500 [Enterococcus faecium]AQT56833.1 Bacterial Ig-like domain (group 2) [Enterococcus faecium]